MASPVESERIPAGGRELYVEWYGGESPTVVIEVGSTVPGTSDPGWQPIVDKLAWEMGVVLYDRAGLGLSDATTKPRKLADFTHDLRAVLAGFRPPFVLVGMSFGGMIVTDYASRYPGDVSGLLLLDSTHPAHNARCLPLVPEETPGEPSSLSDFRRQMWLEQHAPLETDEWEGLDAADAMEQAKNWNLRDIPLVVLTAGRDEWEPDFPQDVAKRYVQEWLQIQREYAALSSRSFHRVVGDSDHIIHDRRPDLVIAAIRALARGIPLSAIDERPNLRCP